MLPKGAGLMFSVAGHDFQPWVAQGHNPLVPDVVICRFGRRENVVGLGLADQIQDDTAMLRQEAAQLPQQGQLFLNGWLMICYYNTISSASCRNDKTNVTFVIRLDVQASRE